MCQLHGYFARIASETAATVTSLSQKSELAVSIRYALSRWASLLRYRDDGRLEIDNNAAERALRVGNLIGVLPDALSGGVCGGG